MYLRTYCRECVETSSVWKSRAGFESMCVETGVYEATRGVSHWRLAGSIMNTANHVIIKKFQCRKPFPGVCSSSGMRCGWAKAKASIALIFDTSSFFWSAASLSPLYYIWDCGASPHRFENFGLRHVSCRFRTAPRPRTALIFGRSSCFWSAAIYCRFDIFWIAVRRAPG